MRSSLHMQAILGLSICSVLNPSCGVSTDPRPPKIYTTSVAQSAHASQYFGQPGQLRNPANQESKRVTKAKTKSLNNIRLSSTSSSCQFLVQVTPIAVRRASGTCQDSFNEWFFDGRCATMAATVGQPPFWRDGLCRLERPTISVAG
jgi:hypothetical protein